MGCMGIYSERLGEPFASEVIDSWHGTGLRQHGNGQKEECF